MKNITAMNVAISSPPRSALFSFFSQHFYRPSAVWPVGLCDSDPKSQAAALNSKQTESRCSPINGIVKRTMSPSVGVAAAVLALGFAADRCSVGRAEVSWSTSLTAGEHRTA